MHSFIRAFWLAKHNDLMLCYYQYSPGKGQDWSVWHVLSYAELKEKRFQDAYTVIIDFKKGKVKYL